VLGDHHPRVDLSLEDARLGEVLDPLLAAPHIGEDRHEVEDVRLDDPLGLLVGRVCDSSWETVNAPSV
jgi:hypothetical protein